MKKDKGTTQAELAELTWKNIERCSSNQRCVKKEIEKVENVSNLSAVF